MDYDEPLLDGIGNSLSLFRTEKGKAVGYVGHFSIPELEERLSKVEQSLQEVIVELESLEDNPIRDRLLKRIEASGRYRINPPTMEVLKEEEAVMSRIADLIRQKAILVARKNDILSCIKRKKGTVEEMMNSHMKQIKNFKQVKGL